MTVIDLHQSDVTRPCDSEPIIGAHGDYDPRDLHFIRSIREGRSPDVGLVPSPPVESWGRTARHTVAYGAFFLACYYLLPPILGVIVDWWIGR